MSKSIRANDRLVPRHHHPGQAADQPARTGDFRQLERRFCAKEVEARFQRQRHFLQRGVAGPFSDSVDRAFDLVGAA
ncbi:hypothetical protein D3C74_235370 [compost metagenome]